jgi:hypothetical protein
MNEQLLSILPKGTPPEVIAAVQDAARDALERHGGSAFLAPIEAAVTHEVGHAIVGTHEGFTIRCITIHSRSVPILGELWGGRCMEAGGTWTTGPNSTADEDLRRARFIIAGLAGEAMAGHDRPGSSIYELALSQLVGINAALKLGDLTLSDAARSAYAKQLWHTRVWGVAVAILRNNYHPFRQLAEHLYQHKQVKSEKLRKLLAQVRRIGA